MSRKRSSATIPEGLKLLHTLRGHKSAIKHLAWSPFTDLLVTVSEDKAIRVWNSENGGTVSSGTLPQATLDIAWSPMEMTLAQAAHRDPIQLLDPLNVEEAYATLGGGIQRVGHYLTDVSGASAISWSPDGQFLAAEAFFSHDIDIWSLAEERSISTLSHSKRVNSLAWSPYWGLLASGSEDGNVKLWDMETDQLIHSFEDHTGAVHQVAWSRDAKLLASASADQTIRIWNPKTLQPIKVLEEHKDKVTSVSFSFDHRLLASKSHDGTVCLWRCDTWEMVACLKEPSSGASPLKISFSQIGPYLATLDEEDTVIRIWEFDIVALYKARSSPAPQLTKPKPLPRGRKFDVFLAHNAQDKPQVRTIAEKLRARNLKPWLDEEQIPSGRWFQDHLQEAVKRVKSAAIFIGPTGMGKWQMVEYRMLISQCVKANLPVIPVLLPGVNGVPEDLAILEELDQVRFGSGIDDEAALDDLEWGIKGKRPSDNSD